MSTRRSPRLEKQTTKQEETKEKSKKKTQRVVIEEAKAKEQKTEEKHQKEERDSDDDFQPITSWTQKKRTLSPSSSSSSAESALAPPKKIQKTSAPSQPKKKKPSSSTSSASSSVTPSNSSAGNMIHIGAHVSIAGGAFKAIERATEIGATAFAMFTCSSRSWTTKAIDPAEALKFRTLMKESKQFHHLPEDGVDDERQGYPFVLPHGSYLVNMGSPNEETRQKSKKFFLEELKRVHALGLGKLNIHPGSSTGEITKEKSMELIAEGINWALENSSKPEHFPITSNALPPSVVLENTAGAGNTIGQSFEEIKFLIDRIQDKSRLGVCLDTCHMFAAGYDLRSKELFDQVIADFDRIVGLQFLQGMHINDSKTDFGSHKDRHENIGKGKLGIHPFHFLMNDPRLKKIPLILETPEGDYAREIQLLRDMAGASLPPSS